MSAYDTLPASRPKSLRSCGKSIISPVTHDHTREPCVIASPSRSAEVGRGESHPGSILIDNTHLPAGVAREPRDDDTVTRGPPCADDAVGIVWVTPGARLLRELNHDANKRSVS